MEIKRQTRPLYQCSNESKEISMQTQEQIAGGQRRFWTYGELDKLNSLYPDTPMNELVRLLKRPASSIYAKAKELRVKRSADFLAGEHSGRVRAGNRRGLATRFKKSSR
jgi:hypothetical protein